LWIYADRASVASGHSNFRQFHKTMHNCAIVRNTLAALLAIKTYEVFQAKLCDLASSKHNVAIVKNAVLGISAILSPY
jgi:hypothetical protein